MGMKTNSIWDKISKTKPAKSNSASSKIPKHRPDSGGNRKSK